MIFLDYLFGHNLNLWLRNKLGAEEKNDGYWYLYVERETSDCEEEGRGWRLQLLFNWFGLWLKEFKDWSNFYLKNIELKLRKVDMQNQLWSLTDQIFWKIYSEEKIKNDYFKTSKSKVGLLWTKVNFVYQLYLHFIILLILYIFMDFIN